MQLFLGLVGTSISIVDFHVVRSCATTCQFTGSVSLVILDMEDVRAVSRYYSGSFMAFVYFMY